MLSHCLHPGFHAFRIEQWVTPWQYKAMRLSLAQKELLAVGLLAAGLLVALLPSLFIQRAEVRDDLKRQDIATLKRQAEDFYNQHEYYPDELPSPYRYLITDTAAQHTQGYYLEAQLERPSVNMVGFDEDEKRKYHFRVLSENNQTLYRVCGGTELQCQSSTN